MMHHGHQSLHDQSSCSSGSSGENQENPKIMEIWKSRYRGFQLFLVLYFFFQLWVQFSTWKTVFQRKMMCHEHQSLHYQSSCSSGSSYSNDMHFCKKWSILLRYREIADSDNIHFCKKGSIIIDTVISRILTINTFVKRDQLNPVPRNRGILDDIHFCKKGSIKDLAWRDYVIQKQFDPLYSRGPPLTRSRSGGPVNSFVCTRSDKMLRFTNWISILVLGEPANVLRDDLRLSGKRIHFWAPFCILSTFRVRKQ